MDLLLDTHAFMWFIDGNRKLSVKARQEIENIQNNRFLSIASLWEMGIKISLGRLKVTHPFDKTFEFLRINKITILNISFQHILEVTNLDFHHRDPFDRIIIAQAIIEDLKIVGKDSVFKNYPIELIW